MRKAKRLGTALAASAMLIGATAAPALAGDHLFNGSTSPGADQRGFANPVTANPSGTSGAAAKPATVPGEGNPNAGLDQGTPSVDLSAVSVRSGGNGDPQAQ
ncbi:MAG TPA: hypothetical protein VFJ72_09135 [Rubrobacteraceae bacterium]|nr:hypothetical protein [Rubrobacteraceae bacterium]